MKKLLALLLCIMMMLPAAKSEEVANAWREAVLHVPASAMPSAMENEGGMYVFLFEDSARNIQYHVEMVPENLFVSSVRMNISGKGAKRATYASKKLEAMVKETYPGSDWQGTYLLQQDGLSRYVLFLMDKEYGQFYRLEYDASTGDMLSYTVREQAAFEEGGGLLTMAEAAEKAQAFAKGSVVADAQLMKIEGRFVFRILLIVGGEEITLTVDALTGECSEMARQATLLQPAGSSTRRAAPTRKTQGQTQRSNDDDDDRDDDDDDDDD